MEIPDFFRPNRIGILRQDKDQRRDMVCVETGGHASRLQRIVQVRKYCFRPQTYLRRVLERV